MRNIKIRPNVSILKLHFLYNPWDVFDENLRIQSAYHPLSIIIKLYYHTMNSPKEKYSSTVKNVSKNSSSIKVNSDEKNVSKTPGRPGCFVSKNILLLNFQPKAGFLLVKVVSIK